MYLFKALNFMELVATFGSSLTMMSMGAVMGWTSPILPKLFDPDSHIPISSDEGSWISSLYLLGAAAGPIITSTLLNSIGRRSTVVMAAIPYITSWILIIVANSNVYLFIARLIGGIGVGMSCVATPIYVGEIASKEIRGTLGVLSTTLMKVGILLCYCVGSYATYETLAYVLMVIPIIQLTTLLWIPETPIYYLTKGREEDAQRSLKYLRPHKSSAELAADLESMYKSVPQNQNHAEAKDLFTSRENLIVVLKISVIFVGVHVSGYMVVMLHSVEIFQEAAGSIGPNESAIILAVIQLLTTFVVSFAIDKVGRRPLLLASIGGTLVINVTMGGYFFAKDYMQADVSFLKWLPVTAMVIFIIFFNVGLAPIPFLFLGELLPTEIKGLATTFILSLNFLIGFSVTKLYQIVTDAFGMYVSYWSFGVLSLGVFLFLYFILPETKGKSLHEIQKILFKNK